MKWIVLFAREIDLRFGDLVKVKTITLPVAKYCDAKPMKASMARRPFLISLSFIAS